MRFSIFTSQLPALTTLLGAATAVEIRFYHNTYSCGGYGSYYDYWYNIPAYACWRTPADSHAVQFFDVPEGGKGQVYTDYPGSCSYYGGSGGSGTYCLDASFFYSAGWFWPYKLARRDEAEDGPSSIGVQYVTPDGATRRINCTDDKLDHVHKLIDGGEWDTLAGFLDGESRNL